MSNPINIDYGNVKSVQTRVTSAQIKSMSTTPVLLTQAPSGTNTVIIPNKFVFSFDWQPASAQYAGGGAIFVRWGTGLITAASAFVNASVLTSVNSSSFINVSLSTTSVKGIAATSNLSLYLTNQTTPFTTGTFDMVITTYYSIIQPNGS